MTRVLTASLAAVVLATAAPADPSPQLVASVQRGLKEYGLSYDVSQFSTSTIVRLHFAMTAKDELESPRNDLLTILRSATNK